MPPKGQGLPVDAAEPPVGVRPVCKEVSPGGIHKGGRESMYADDLKRIATGDEESLKRIIEEFGPFVHSIALRVTGSEADAEDVAQEVFIGLPKALQSFSDGNFPGWLKVVTRRHAQMLVRGERRRRRLLLPLSVVEGSGDRTLSRIMIEKALLRIDPMQREVFLLKVREGWSHKEIAESMNITKNNSQVLLHRARKALKELIS